MAAPKSIHSTYTCLIIIINRVRRILPELVRWRVANTNNQSCVCFLRYESYHGFKISRNFLLREHFTIHHRRHNSRLVKTFRRNNYTDNIVNYVSKLKTKRLQVSWSINVLKIISNYLSTSHSKASAKPVVGVSPKGLCFKLSDKILW